tara:strand:+ start:542 stop:1225 length:684 start_codon:yes stop_codon:yes gene_type:complete
MQFGPDMPIPMNNNRVLKAVMNSGPSDDEAPELAEYREQLRENELNLLGSMLFHAVVLGASILLYTKWEWSQFGTPYESATFYALAAFFVQAGFYFMWRAAFEDSSSHRRRMRKMRLKNRKRIQGIRYSVEEAQQEATLRQQMYELQMMLTNSLEDDVITTEEGNDLLVQFKKLQQMMGQSTSLGSNTESTQVRQSSPTAIPTSAQQVIPGQALQPQGAKGYVHDQQ